MRIGIAPESLSRFWEKVDKSGECWRWTGSCSDFGYGRVRIEKKEHRAHRLSYELYNGPIPEGLQVCHRCDTAGCVRPSHLFLGSQMDNVRDMWNKGRGRSHVGVLHPRAKLKEGEVGLLRRLGGVGISYAVLSQMFRVDYTTARMAVLGRSWSHLPGALPRLHRRLRTGEAALIRRLVEGGVTQSILSKMFRVSQSNISRIKSSEKWRGVKWAALA